MEAPWRTLIGRPPSVRTQSDYGTIYPSRPSDGGRPIGRQESKQVSTLQASASAARHRTFGVLLSDPAFHQMVGQRRPFGVRQEASCRKLVDTSRLCVGPFQNIFLSSRSVGGRLEDSGRTLVDFSADQSALRRPFLEFFLSSRSVGGRQEDSSRTLVDYTVVASRLSGGPSTKILFLQSVGCRTLGGLLSDVQNEAFATRNQPTNQRKCQQKV